MTFYTPHSRVTLSCGDFTHTKQNHKAECDINNIIKQYQKTGILSHIQNASAQYIDLPSQFDYQDALNTVLDAEAAFADLPSKIRDRFGNDPGQLLAALQNPAFKSELTELGILKSPPSPSPSGVDSVPPVPGAA